MRFIITLLLLSSCLNQGESERLDITKWEVLYSQSDFLEIQTSQEWDNLKLDDLKLVSFSRKGRYQYIWLKGEVYVASPENFKGVNFSYLPPVNSVYINNTLISESGISERRDMGGARTYYIPSNSLKVGNNIIYIKIGEFDSWDIEIGPEVTIGNSPLYIKNKTINNLINETVPMFVLSILVISLLTFLLKGLMEKYNREYLILGLRLSLIILCFLSFSSPVPIFTTAIIESIWSRVIPLFCVCLVLQPQITYTIYFTKLNRIIISLLLLSSMINITALIGVSISFSIVYLIFICTKILKNRKRNFKIILVLIDSSILLINIITVFIFIAFRTYILDPSIVVIVSSIILTIIYTVYFAKRDSIRRLDLISLKNRLDELDKNVSESKKYKLSTQLEEKMESLLHFIKENHSTMVTRELLAETIGVSPNYLSSLFNSYTGKKINEYINDIRIEDASNKLLTSDSSVTDIAFSSGFESLTTFNRIFKKKFGVSPKVYREKK